MTTITIAQLTDIHLSPLPAFHPRDWNLKRLSGYLNWHRSRRDAYRPDVLARIVAHMQASQPDHIAVTGDLVNIALPEEMQRAARWLATLGPAEKVSVIPGNHDIYCEIGSAPGIGLWAACMTNVPALADTAAPFPFVRRIGPVALIGVNSALPRPPFVASGEVGDAQRGRLARLLDRLGSEGAIRVVMIHHPPLPGQAPPSRGLDDAGELAALLRRHGAELVIHGHNHRRMLASIEGPRGSIPLVGAPSASLGVRHGSETLARYYSYRITPAARGAAIELIAHGLAEPGGEVVELERRVL